MPPQQLCLVALNPTDSVTEGFLPAAAALGLRVTLLTDQPSAHERAYAGLRCAPAEIVECDVRDYLAIIDHVDRRDPFDAVFSNSDHLQTQTALAASHAGLPAKDWRAALRAKNKAQLRRHIARLGVDQVWSRELLPGRAIEDIPFPCVVKPREGVASEDVVLVHDSAEVRRTCTDIWQRKPDQALVVEEFLAGDLHTLETIGDGGTPEVLGGFRTTLSPPPYFIEQSMVFDPTPPAWQVDAVLEHLRALRVGFGACHTEYLVAGDQVRLIEVNYRAIGDQCDLMLAELTGVPLFQHILRVHLGEPLPVWQPAVAAGRVDYRCADRSGRLAAAPPRTDELRDGVRLAYRPLRAVGETRAHTNTNRDYLGVLRTIGPDQTTVDRTAAQFLAAQNWDIQP
ncbi:MAG TPA: ATP-grasp domain-containing protein [Pseudonocardiaceae bacterium]|nr:ATP-grasp domain-containing protein [Pseudonocardiaceae bacterium]